MVAYRLARHAGGDDGRAMYLIMTPGEHHVLQPAVGRVDAVLGGVDRILEVRVSDEGVGVDDLVGELASNDEGVLES